MRYKQASRKLEVEARLDEVAGTTRMVQQVLASTETPAQDGYCIATIHEGILYMTSISSVFQMRPRMAHLNVNEERRKEHSKSCEIDAPSPVRLSPSHIPTLDGVFMWSPPQC